MPATNTNEVWFLYDDENLYVGWKAGDQDSGNVVVNELREDFFWRDSDGVSVIIDSLHDESSGFLFGTNPAGARRDSQISNDGDLFNGNWDGVWDVEVTVTPRAGPRNTGFPLRPSDSPMKPNRCGG